MNALYFWAVLLNKKSDRSVTDNVQQVPLQLVTTII